MILIDSHMTKSHDRVGSHVGINHVEGKSETVQIVQSLAFLEGALCINCMQLIISQFCEPLLMPVKVR